MSTNSSGERPLRELQQEFFRLVTAPLDADDRSRSAFSDGSSAEKAAELLVKPGGGFTSLQRTELYNRQYWFRLIDSVAEDFPGLRSLMGAASFYEMTIAYLKRYPSSSFSMRYLGRHLAQFLKEEPSWLGEDVEFGIEVAEIEYAQSAAFEAASFPALNPAQIVAVSLGEMTFMLQPCVFIFELQYPVDEWLRSTRTFERDASEASHSEEACRFEEGHERLAPPEKKPTWLAVHRHNLKIYFKALDKPQFEVLSALKRGETLAEGLDRGIEALPEESLTPKLIAKAIQGWFAVWGELSWFSKAPERDSLNGIR